VLLDNPWWELAPKLSPLESSFDDFMKGHPVEELLAKVGPAVEDCIQRIVTTAVPYFARMAEKHGYQLSKTNR